VSLDEWFKEDWVRISTTGKILGPCGKREAQDNPARCLPRNKAESLSREERAATARKKKEAGKKGQQFVANTRKAKVKK